MQKHDEALFLTCKLSAFNLLFSHIFSAKKITRLNFFRKRSGEHYAHCTCAYLRHEIIRKH